VWRQISAPGYLEECHPFCAANPVEVWPGGGSIDRIEYHNGRQLVRSFVAWYEGEGYDVEITDANGEVADVAWRLAAAPQGSVLSIAITPKMLDGRAAPIRWLAGFVVRPMLRRYLQSVLSGVEYRVVTGQPVTHNQFGSHAWFSPVSPR